MSKNFASLQERLGKAFAGRFHLITISFDPEHDTPEVLKRYAAVFTQDESTWTFATGTTRQVERVASQFGLVYLPEAGSFTHDLRTALISPEGRLIHVWRSNVWTPYEVQRRVAEVLQPAQTSPPLVSASAIPKSL
jgi:protein SCO1/2